MASIANWSTTTGCMAINPLTHQSNHSIMCWWNSPRLSHRFPWFSAKICLSQSMVSPTPLHLLEVVHVIHVSQGHILRRAWWLPEFRYTYVWSTYHVWQEDGDEVIYNIYIYIILGYVMLCYVLLYHLILYYIKLHIYHIIWYHISFLHISKHIYLF